MNTPTFAELGVPEELCDSLRTQGITEAFPIQVEAIPPALQGHDVCGKAPTGSGKTLAFAVPLVNRARKARPRRPRGLVLTPTRELASQIADEVRGLSRSRVTTFFGGTGYGAQLKALRRGVDIAVACPGRLMDLLQRNEIDLSQVEICVVDEADRMADMGFLPDVRRILDQTPPSRQTLLFSATLDGAVDTLISRYQQDPIRCTSADDSRDGLRVAHSFIRVDRPEKVHKTRELAALHQSVVTFCRTKRGADRLARRLRDNGVEVAHIHGDRTQRQRDRALRAFREGSAQMLVATDVAARGIHIDNVDCVIHYDLAADSKDYIHRSGRTGRAGASGTVVSLVSGEETGQLTKLRPQLELPVVSFDPELQLRTETRNGSKPRRANTTGRSSRNSNRRRRRPTNRRRK